nr:hypothetical protein CFP56_16241 [Quercus suber]
MIRKLGKVKTSDKNSGSRSCDSTAPKSKATMIEPGFRISNLPDHTHTSSFDSVPSVLIPSENTSSDEREEAISATFGAARKAYDPLFHSDMTLRTKDLNKNAAEDSTSAKKNSLAPRSTETPDRDTNGMWYQAAVPNENEKTPPTRTAKLFSKGKHQTAWAKADEVSFSRKLKGTTWIWKRDRQLWPVVLCDDDLPPKAFTRTRHNDRHVTAILLGQRKYVEGLQPYDPRKVYLQRAPQILEIDSHRSDDQKAKIEEQRQRAFTLDGPMFETPRFWKNYIDNAHVIRGLGKAGRRRKRRQRSLEEDEGQSRGRRAGSWSHHQADQITRAEHLDALH